MRFWLAVAVLFVSTIVAFLFAFDASTTSQRSLEFALSWSLRFAGGLIALAATVGLLHQWWSGSLRDQLHLCLVPFLAGALLYAQSWATALALGIVGAALTAGSGGVPSQGRRKSRILPFRRVSMSTRESRLLGSAILGAGGAIALGLADLAGSGDMGAIGGGTTLAAGGNLFAVDWVASWLSEDVQSEHHQGGSATTQRE